MEDADEAVTDLADGGVVADAAALTDGRAMILYGLATTSGCVLTRWTGWFAAADGLLLLGQSVLTDDAVPALLYPRTTYPSGSPH